MHNVKEKKINKYLKLLSNTHLICWKFINFSDYFRRETHFIFFYGQHLWRKFVFSEGFGASFFWKYYLLKCWQFELISTILYQWEVCNVLEHFQWIRDLLFDLDLFFGGIISTHLQRMADGHPGMLYSLRINNDISNMQYQTRQDAWEPCKIMVYDMRFYPTVLGLLIQWGKISGEILSSCFNVFEVWECGWLKQLGMFLTELNEIDQSCYRFSS